LARTAGILLLDMFQKKQTISPTTSAQPCQQTGHHTKTYRNSNHGHLWLIGFPFLDQCYDIADIPQALFTAAIHGGRRADTELIRAHYNPALPIR
jgi:hypothetical protein